MPEKNFNNIYISLQEAANYCDYSQKYLSLRARQGKLKAVKIGRNWLTKKEWVKEYVERVEEYNNNFRVKKLAPPAFVKTTTGKPPENLPIEEIVRVRPVQLRPALAIALVFVLLIAGGVLGKTSFQNVFKNVSPFVQEFKEDFDRNIISTAKEIENLAKNVSSYYAAGSRKSFQFLAAISSPDVLKSTLNTFKEFGIWVNENIKSSAFALQTSADRQISNIKSIYLAANDFVERKISQGFKTISQFFKKSEKIVEEKPIPKSAEEGLVVIPSTEKDEEVVKKIKESFSDEVIVEAKDETSGFIIPIFKKGEGEKYFYILVPIKN